MNKKIKNATCVEISGIKFKSKLEAYTYRALKQNGFNVLYEPKRFTLIPAFEFNNKKIRAITYKPDFIIDDKIVIECKGYRNDSWPLRKKLFEYALVKDNLKYDFYEVHTQKEVDTLVLNLKERNYV